jgi:hypothetical protein
MTKKKKLPILSATVDLKVGFTHLLFNLFAQGYSHICFEYSGGGDSGCIDSVTAYRIGDVEVTEEKEIKVKDKAKTAELESELRDILDNAVTSKILEEADDWWNNEGGGGTLWLDCRDASYIGDHYINITTTEESKLEGKLGDGASVRA